MKYVDSFFVINTNPIILIKFYLKLHYISENIRQGRGQQVE